MQKMREQNLSRYNISKIHPEDKNKIGYGKQFTTLSKNNHHHNHLIHSHGEESNKLRQLKTMKYSVEK